MYSVVSGVFGFIHFYCLPREKSLGAWEGTRKGLEPVSELVLSKSKRTRIREEEKMRLEREQRRKYARRRAEEEDMRRRNAKEKLSKAK